MHACIHTCVHVQYVLTNIKVANVYALADHAFLDSVPGVSI